MEKDVDKPSDEDNSFTDILYGDITDAQDRTETAEDISHACQDDVDGENAEDDLNFDLYDDIIAEEDQQEMLSYQEMCKKFEVAMKMITDLEKENKVLRAAVQDRETTSQTVKRNMSSLLVTARGEISRKEKEIEELRQNKKKSFNSPRRFLTQRDNAARNLSLMSIDSTFDPMHVSSPSSISDRLQSVAESPSRGDKGRKGEPQARDSPTRRDRDEAREPRASREDPHSRHRKDGDKYKSPEKNKPKNSERSSRRESKRNLDKSCDKDQRRKHFDISESSKKRESKEKLRNTMVKDYKNENVKHSPDKTSPSRDKTSLEIRDDSNENRNEVKVLDLREKLRLKRLKAGTEKGTQDRKESEQKITSETTLQETKVNESSSSIAERSWLKDSPTKTKVSEARNALEETVFCERIKSSIRSAILTKVTAENDEFDKNGTDYDTFGTGRLREPVVTEIADRSRKKISLAKTKQVDGGCTLSDDESFLKKLKSSVISPKFTSSTGRSITCSDNKKEEKHANFNESKRNSDREIIGYSDCEASIEDHENQLENVNESKNINRLVENAKSAPNNQQTGSVNTTESKEELHSSKKKYETLRGATTKQLNDTHTTMEVTANDTNNINETWTECQMETDDMNDTKESRRKSNNKSDSGDIQALYDDIGTENEMRHSGEQVDDLEEEVFSRTATFGSSIDSGEACDDDEKVNGDEILKKSNKGRTNNQKNSESEIKDSLKEGNEHLSNVNKSKTNSKELRSPNENEKMIENSEDHIKGRLRERTNSSKTLSEIEGKCLQRLRRVTSETISSVTSAEMSKSVSEMFKNLSSDLEEVYSDNADKSERHVDEINVSESEENKKVQSKPAECDSDIGKQQDQNDNSDNGNQQDQNENHVCVSNSEQKIDNDMKQNETVSSKVMMNRACDKDGCNIKFKHIHPKSKINEITETSTDNVKISFENNDSNESSLMSDSESDCSSGTGTDSSTETESFSETKDNRKVKINKNRNERQKIYDRQETAQEKSTNAIANNMRLQEKSANEKANNKTDKSIEVESAANIPEKNVDKTDSVNVLHKKDDGSKSVTNIDNNVDTLNQESNKTNSKTCDIRQTCNDIGGHRDPENRYNKVENESETVQTSSNETVIDSDNLKKINTESRSDSESSQDRNVKSGNNTEVVLNKSNIETELVANDEMETDTEDNTSECDSEGSFGSNILSEKTASIGTSDVSGSSVTWDSSDTESDDSESSYSTSGDDEDGKEDKVDSHDEVGESITIENETAANSKNNQNLRTVTESPADHEAVMIKVTEKVSHIEQTDIAAHISVEMSENTNNDNSKGLTAKVQIPVESNKPSKGNEVKTVQEKSDDVDNNMEVDIDLRNAEESNEKNRVLSSSVENTESAKIHNNSNSELSMEGKRDVRNLKNNVKSPRKTPRKTPTRQSSPSKIYSVLNQSPDKSFLLQSLLCGVNLVMETKKSEENINKKQKTEPYSIDSKKQAGFEIKLSKYTKPTKPSEPGFDTLVNDGTGAINSHHEKMEVQIDGSSLAKLNVAGKISEENEKMNNLCTNKSHNNDITLKQNLNIDKEDVSEYHGNLSEIKVFGSNLSISSDSSDLSSVSSHPSSCSTCSSASHSSSGSSSSGSSVTSENDEEPVRPAAKQLEQIPKETCNSDKIVTLEKLHSPMDGNSKDKDKILNLEKVNGGSLGRTPTKEIVEKPSEVETPIDVVKGHCLNVLPKNKIQKQDDVTNKPDEMANKMDVDMQTAVKVNANPYIEIDEMPDFLLNSSESFKISETESENTEQTKLVNRMLTPSNNSLVGSPTKPATPAVTFKKKGGPASSPRNFIKSGKGQSDATDDDQTKEKGQHDTRKTMDKEKQLENVSLENLSTLENQSISNAKPKEAVGGYTPRKVATSTLTKKDIIINKNVPPMDKTLKPKTDNKKKDKVTPENKTQRISPRKKKISQTNMAPNTKTKDEEVVLRRSPRKKPSNTSVKSQGLPHKAAKKEALFTDTKSDEALVKRSSLRKQPYKSNSVQLEKLTDKSRSPRKRHSSKSKNAEKVKEKSRPVINNDSTVVKEYKVSRDMTSPGIKLKVCVKKTDANKTSTIDDKDACKHKTMSTAFNKNKFIDTGKELTDMIMKLKAEQDELRKTLQQQNRENSKNENPCTKGKASSSNSKESIKSKESVSPTNSKGLNINKKLKHNEHDAAKQTNLHKPVHLTKRSDIKNDNALKEQCKGVKTAASKSNNSLTKSGSMNLKETRNFENKVTDYEDYILNMKPTKVCTSKMLNKKSEPVLKLTGTDIAVRHVSTVKTHISYKIPKVTSSVSNTCTKAHKSKQAPISKDKESKSVNRNTGRSQPSSHDSAKHKQQLKSVSLSPKKKGIHSSRSGSSQEKKITELKMDDSDESTTDISSSLDADSDTDVEVSDSDNGDVSDMQDKLVKAIFGSSDSSAGSRKSLKLADLRQTRSSEDTDDVVKDGEGKLKQVVVPSHKETRGIDNEQKCINDRKNISHPKEKTPLLKEMKGKVDDLLERYNSVKSGAKSGHDESKDKAAKKSEDRPSIAKSGNISRIPRKSGESKSKHEELTEKTVNCIDSKKVAVKGKAEDHSNVNKHSKLLKSPKPSKTNNVSKEDQDLNLKESTNEIGVEVIFGNSELRSSHGKGNNDHNIVKSASASKSSLLLLDDENTMDGIDYEDNVDFENEIAESDNESDSEDSGDDQKDGENTVREAFESHDAVDSVEEGEVTSSESEMGVLTPRKSKVNKVKCHRVEANLQFSPIKFPSFPAGDKIAIEKLRHCMPTEGRNIEIKKSGREIIRYESESDSCNEVYTPAKDRKLRSANISDRRKTIERIVSPKVGTVRSARHRSPIERKKQSRSPTRRSRSPRYRSRRSRSFSPRRERRHRSRSHSPSYKRKRSPTPPRARERDDRIRRRDSIRHRHRNRNESDIDSPNPRKKSSRRRDSSIERTPDVKSKHRVSEHTRCRDRRERIDSVSSCYDSSHHNEDDHITKRLIHDSPYRGHRKYLEKEDGCVALELKKKVTEEDVIETKHDSCDESRSSDDDERFSKLHSEKKKDRHISDTGTRRNAKDSLRMRVKDDGRGRKRRLLEARYSHKRRYHSSSDSGRSRSRSPRERVRKRRRLYSDSETDLTEGHDRQSKQKRTDSKSELSEKENLHSLLPKKMQTEHGNVSGRKHDSSRDISLHDTRSKKRNRRE